MENADNKIILYHASTVEVRRPIWNFKGSESKKDFGIGFYTCADDVYPIKLYSDHDVVILNKYELDMAGLRILRLENDIKWLLLTGFHRRDFNSRPKWFALRDKIRKTLENYDMVIGAISNDNFYSTMEDYLDGEITDYMAIHLAQLMHYSDQYVFKSSIGCERLNWIDSKQIGWNALLKFRQEKTQEKDEMKLLVRNERRRLAPYDNGKYIDEIVGEMIANGV